MEEQNRREEQMARVDIRHIQRVLWRRRWYVLVPLVIAVFGAIALTLIATPIYRAEALLRVSGSAALPERASPFAGLFLSRQAVPSFLELARSPSILSQVASNLDLESRNETMGEVTASQVEQTEFFRISVKHRNPTLASLVANEVAQVIEIENELEWESQLATSELLLQFNLDEVQTKIHATRQALASLLPDQDKRLLELQLVQYESQYSSLLKQFQESQLRRTQHRDILSVLAPATIPSRPVSPNPRNNLIQGIILGIIMGIGAAYIREYFDDTPKSPEDVHRLLGVPVLGAIPLFQEVKTLKDGLISRHSNGPPMDEPYHLVRTNLQYSQPDESSKIVLITSSQIGEGKTTTAANLAIVMAQVGKKVILVDADLRRPQIHEIFGLPMENGIVDVVNQKSGPNRTCLKKTYQENLSVLTAGSRVEQPAPILGSERMQQLLARLREWGDVVLVDSPPVLYASDAVLLSTQTDLVLLVLGSGMPSGESVQRAHDAFSRVKAKRMDVVLNKVRRESDAYSYYSYYYHNYYKSQSR